MAGSSAPLSGAKLSVRVTTTSTGKLLPRVTWRRGCWSGLAVSETPATVRFSGGVEGNPMVTGKLLEVLAPAASFTVTTMVAGPAAVGVPEIAPAADMLRPAGSPLALKVSGAVPPDAAKLAEYAVPTVPMGAEAVVIASGAGAMVTGEGRLAGAMLVPAASVTLTITVKLPAFVGVPLMAPAAVAVTPSGRPVTVRLYGGTPPDAVRLAE